MRRLILLALAGAVLGAPAAADARARVQTMVVGKSAVLSGPKRVALVARTARVGGERCSIGRATPLSVLAGAGVSFSLKDYGACSRRARDAGSLYVRRIGPDRESGRDGWVYKVGRRAGSAGPPIPPARSGPDASCAPGSGCCGSGASRTRSTPASGRSRSGPRLTQTAAGAPLSVTVRGYDDTGAGCSSRARR